MFNQSFFFIKAIVSLSATKRMRLELIEGTDENISDVGIGKEVEQYLSCIIIDKTVLLLDWWKANKNSLPYLSQLAQIYHGKPSTSASSETAFSTSGNTMIAKRSSLLPSKLKMLCFVHDNFENIKKSVTEIIEIND